MAATVVEVQTGVVAGSGGTFTFTLANAVLTTDVLVLAYERGRTGSYTKTGSVGATGWTNAFLGSNGSMNQAHYVDWKTGVALAVGATLTITTSGLTAFSSNMALFLLRGLNVPSGLPVASGAGWDGVSIGSATTFYSPDTTVGVDQIAIGIGYRSSITAFPASPLPASGWTTDFLVSGRGSVAHLIGTADSTLHVGITGSSSLCGAATVVFGTATTPPPAGITVVAHGDNTGSAPVTVPLTGMTAGEALVVVMYIAQGATVDTTIMGTAATWHTRRLSVGFGTHRYSHTTGHTGNGSVVFTSSISHEYSYVVYRLAGLTNPASIAISNSTWDRVEGANTDSQDDSLSGTSEYPPALLVGTGQMCIFFGSAQQDINQGDVKFPAAGWTTDHVKNPAINILVASLKVTTPGIAQNSIKGSGGGGVTMNNMAATLLRFGDATLPAVTDLPVHVAEERVMELNASATRLHAVQTSLVPNDVVLVLGVRHSPTNNLTISGLGATWVQAFNLNDTVRGVQGHYATGITGTGTITVLNGNGGEKARALILILRNLALPVLGGIQQTDWTTATTLHDTPEYAPEMTFGPGRIAVALGFVSTVNVAAIVPAPGSTPSSGWIQDQAALGNNLGTVYETHRIGDGSTPLVMVGIQGFSTPQPLNVVTMVFGGPGTPTAGGPDMGGTWGG